MANKRERVNELAMEAVRAVVSGDVEQIEVVRGEVTRALEEDVKELKEMYENETDPAEKAKLKKTYEWMKKDFESIKEGIEEDDNTEEEGIEEDITDETIDKMIDSAMEHEFKVVIEANKEGIAAYFEKQNFDSMSDVIINTSLAIAHLIRKVSELEENNKKRNRLRETILGLVNVQLGEPAILIPRDVVKGIIEVTEEDEDEESEE